jgi:UDP-N-acetylmuramate dehydrogenase
MLSLKERYPVSGLTTMKVGGTAHYLAFITSREELVEAVRYGKAKQLRIKAIGAGSNIVFPDGEFEGLVLALRIKGIAADPTPSGVSLVAGAGESWDALVEEAVRRGFFGLENLSAIPGSVGAAPVQNIGAYGLEVASCIESVEVYDMQTESFVTLSGSACAFGYRDSIFKHPDGAHLVVVAVTFRLQTAFRKNASYPDLRRWESEHGELESAAALRNAVIAIRKAKLPDPSVQATAGSFWKNPMLPESDARLLAERFPGLPIFPAGQGFMKISLGWLLDRVLGKKGFRAGKVGLYEKQALALVSYGASESEIDAFAKMIEQEIKERFSIDIEREVEFIS